VMVNRFSDFAMPRVRAAINFIPTIKEYIGGGREPLHGCACRRVCRRLPSLAINPPVMRIRGGFTPFNVLAAEKQGRIGRGRRRESGVTLVASTQTVPHLCTLKMVHH
jgi:hypothetical protein